MSYIELECKEVKVRRSMRCTWCPDMINIGDKAHVRSYVYDGDVHYEKMHPECYKAMLEFFKTSKYKDDLEFEEFQFKRGTIESRW